MRMEPLGDRLIVKPTPAESVTASGIVLPEAAQEKSQKGHVVAVSECARNEDGTTRPLDVRVGEEVLYSKYGGTEITFDGEDLVVMKEADVIARLG